MESARSDLAGDSLGLARAGPNVYRLAAWGLSAWDRRVIGTADALSAAMSREILGPRPAKGTGVSSGDATISASIAADRGRISFVIALRTFCARYRRNPGLEFAITVFSMASIGD
jgi:hypothetical protein